MWIRKGVVTTKRAHNELRAITPKSSARFHSGAFFCPAPDAWKARKRLKALPEDLKSRKSKRARRKGEPRKAEPARELRSETTMPGRERLPHKQNRRLATTARTRRLSG